VKSYNFTFSQFKYFYFHLRLEHLALTLYRKSIRHFYMIKRYLRNVLIHYKLGRILKVLKVFKYLCVLSLRISRYRSQDADGRISCQKLRFTEKIFILAVLIHILYSSVDTATLYIVRCNSLAASRLRAFHIHSCSIIHTHTHKYIFNALCFANNRSFDYYT